MRATRALRCTSITRWGSGVASFFSGGTSFNLATTTLAALLSAGLSNSVATTNPPGTVVGPSGVVQYGAHNLLLNSATLGTQSVTVVSGQQYTVSGYGTGSVTLSGGGTGTLSPGGAGTRGSLTFTASTTSVTFTVTGSITQGQLNLGPTALDYVPTTSAAVYAPRLTCDRGATHNAGAWSEDISQAAWSVTGVASRTTDTLVEDSSNGQHWASQPVTGSASEVWTMTCDVYPGTRTEARVINYDGGSNYFGVIINLTTGAVTTASGGTVTNTGYTATPTGDGGWTVSVTAAYAGTSKGLWVNIASGGSVFYQGNGTGSIRVKRCRWQRGPVALAYLRTFAVAPLYASGTPAQQNLANGSGTQSITVTQGCVYSILHQTGGTYTLSGAATGTTTAGTTTTFVASTGTLTLTASSSPTLLQVWEGTGSMAYVAGPVSVYPQRSLKREPQRTNILPNSATVGAQSITVTSTSVYTFSFEGSSSSVTFSGAYTGTLSTDASGRRQSVTFTAATGTLTIASVTGSPVLGQLELGGWATTYIPNGATTTTRDADLLRPGNVITDGPMTVLAKFRPDKAASGVSQVVWARGAAGAGFLTPAGLWSLIDGTSQPLGTSAFDGVTMAVASAWSGALMKFSQNGAAVVANGFDGTMGSGTNGIGDDGTGAYGFSGDIEQISIVGTFATDTQLQQLSAGTLT